MGGGMAWGIRRRTWTWLWTMKRICVTHGAWQEGGEFFSCEFPMRCGRCSCWRHTRGHANRHLTKDFLPPPWMALVFFGGHALGQEFVVVFACRRQYVRASVLAMCDKLIKSVYLAKSQASVTWHQQNGQNRSEVVWDFSGQTKEEEED